MPLSEIFLVIRWWGTVFLVGAAALPLTRRLLSSFPDWGYGLSKAVGIVSVSYLVWLATSLRILPFTLTTILLAVLVVFTIGVLANRHAKTSPPPDPRLIYKWAISELFFFLLLLFWSWVKAHEPSLRGLEKFMDYGFTQSILNSAYTPAPDMWYAGGTINYYYFGHFFMAMLTRLSSLPLSVTFNLMLATLFAFTFSMSYTIARFLMDKIIWIDGQKSANWIQIFGKVIAGLFAAYLVTLAGNMQTIYAFTKGYTGEDVKPFWELLWPLAELWQKLPEGLNTYWYANATRFIPFTIHEFPSYSFVVSDVHGHVLSLPFVLLAIALLLEIFSQNHQIRPIRQIGLIGQIWKTAFYGLLLGVLLMTNALDGPIYGGLFVILTIVFLWGNWSRLAAQLIVVIVSAGVAISPFFLHFKSFVTGLAVNCPPSFLTNTKIGPILFEEIEKCQVSPIWMWWLLWGFFVYCGIWFIVHSSLVRRSPAQPGETGWLVVKNKHYKWYEISKVISNFTQLQKLLLVIFIYCLGLLIFPEFFYFKDIYPAHFRSNTMFKLGYQAFIMLSLISATSIVWWMHRLRHFHNWKTKLLAFTFLLLLTPQLFLVVIYPLFSVRSYFNSLKTYESIDGLKWLETEYPDDYALINWLKNRHFPDSDSVISNAQLPVIVEADGDSYTDYERVSTFTGLPTIVGWAVHEWLWRGTYDVVAPRREDVRLIYEDQDVDRTRELLQRYRIRYIIIGKIEREKFTALYEDKFNVLAQPVFRSGLSVVYQVN